MTGFIVPIRTLDNRVLKITIDEVIHPTSRKIVSNEGIVLIIYYFYYSFLLLLIIFVYWFLITVVVGMPSSKNPGEKGDLILEFDIAFPK